MACYTPLKGYKDPVSGGLTFNKKGTYQKLEVACGQCLGCRVDYALMWTIRIIHEASLWDDKFGNSWCTLTYRDPGVATDEQYRKGHFIPADYSLRPSDVSKFIRSLRKRNKEKQIRYFYCGEYGELGRPHYHVCLFNHQFHDTVLFEDDEGLYTYTSKSLSELWPHGFSTTTELNYRTAAYTAGYIHKKVTGDRADEHYLRCDEYGVAYWLKPEFTRMSTGNKNPPCGLGAKFYEKFKEDFFPADESPVPGKGIILKVPRYYQNILESTDPSTLELVKSLRQTFYEQHKSDYTEQRLRDKYICAKAQQSRLKRPLQ